MLYEYWNEGDTLYSGYFDFWPEWLFQYYNELSLRKPIKSSYPMWKSEQYRMKPKYHILRLLMPLIKYFNANMEEYCNQFIITCQSCNVFVTWSVRSGELFYVTFIHDGMCTLGIYPEVFYPEILFFQWTARTKIQHLYQKILKKDNCDQM